MKYRIEVKRSAAKALKKIPKPDQKRISKAIDNLAENLPNPDITKMKGNNPFHKIRVGDYRIVYEIQDDILLILIIKIGHRKDIYRHLNIHTLYSFTSIPPCARHQGAALYPFSFCTNMSLPTCREKIWDLS